MTRKTLDDFARNVKRSGWELIKDEDGDQVLVHLKQPGRNKSCVGERKMKYGWKVVLRKDFAPHVIAEVSCRCLDTLSQKRINVDDSPFLWVPSTFTHTLLCLHLAGRDVSLTFNRASISNCPTLIRFECPTPP